MSDSCLKGKEILPLESFWTIYPARFFSCLTTQFVSPNVASPTPCLGEQLNHRLLRTTTRGLYLHQDTLKSCLATNLFKQLQLARTITTMAQTPQQRRANEKFAKHEASKRGKPKTTTTKHNAKPSLSTGWFFLPLLSAVGSYSNC
ncbi:hypothetical protein BDW71DRAFT_44242 [Aspergillus fruticulosus]